MQKQTPKFQTKYMCGRSQVPRHRAYTISMQSLTIVVLPRSKDTPQAQSESQDPSSIESSARSNSVQDKRTSQLPSSQTMRIHGTTAYLPRIERQIRSQPVQESHKSNFQVPKQNAYAAQVQFPSTAHIHILNAEPHKFQWAQKLLKI
jgi:hypothetical protein